jgi:hypothetical protein
VRATVDATAEELSWQVELFERVDEVEELCCEDQERRRHDEPPEMHPALERRAAVEVVAARPAISGEAIVRTLS